MHRYWLEDGLLYNKKAWVYVPKDGCLQQDLLKENHDASWVRHPGHERMKALLARHFYWPDIDTDIEAYVKTTSYANKTSGKEGTKLAFFSPFQSWRSHGLLSL